jgi:hypothetical protein
MDIGMSILFFYLGCNASSFLARYFYTSIILDHLWFLKVSKKINLRLNYYLSF